MRCEGFALVEALASLVIIALIGLMLVAGATTGRRVWERNDTREATAEELDAAQTTLRDRIEQIYPATKTDENPPYIDFRGDADQVVFLANPAAAAQPAPLRRYRLHLDVGGRLLLSSISDLADPGPMTDDQVLVSGAQQLEINYFGPTLPDMQQRWRRVWHDQPALPQIIAVRVTFEPGDHRAWPDLIIHPRTTIDTACLLNPTTHHCKGRA
ncbi:MAG: type II secretion system protein [Caulobacteraceae bacterium]|nr:type II secretion system protein [Caulobacteraceae bacterium]